MKRLFRKHRQLVTFAGAAIVFGTFIVNEIFRDRYKDLVGSVANAQNAFLIRNQYSGLPAQLESVKQQILEEFDTLGWTLGVYRSKGQQERGNPDLLYRFEMDPMESHIQALNINLNNLESLADILPEKNEDHNDIDILRHELIHAREVRSQALDYVVNGPDSGKEAFDKLEGMIREVRKMIVNVTEETGPIEDRVFMQANSLIKKNERYYAVSRWTSYFLYITGWSLGLMASLWGGKKATGGE
jgi:hypothetical protein